MHISTGDQKDITKQMELGPPGSSEEWGFLMLLWWGATPGFGGTMQTKSTPLFDGANCHEAPTLSPGRRYSHAGRGWGRRARGRRWQGVGATCQGAPKGDREGTHVPPSPWIRLCTDCCLVPNRTNPKRLTFILKRLTRRSDQNSQGPETKRN